MSTPIYAQVLQEQTERARGIYRHRGLNVGDFGDWVCGWCGHYGDEHENPAAVPCSEISIRGQIFLSTVKRTVDQIIGLENQAAVLKYAKISLPDIYESLVEVFENANRS